MECQILIPRLVYYIMTKFNDEPNVLAMCVY